MPSRDETEFTLPQLILCEGPADCAFFSALIEERNLPNYHIQHSGKRRNERGGNTQFGEKLRALKINRSFRQVVKRVLVVADSDHDMGSRFEQVRDQLRAAELAVPDRQMVRIGEELSVAVIMLPSNGPGNLECICEPAARAINPAIAAFVDHFVDAVVDHTWTIDKRGKLWLRASIAARWQRDPDIYLAKLFDQQESRRLIPLTHSSFSDLARFIREFAN